MLNIGFIGVGGIAEVHLRHISGMEGTRVAGIYDVNTDRAEEIARKYEGKVYPSLEALLDGEKLDAVYICVPPFAHGDIEAAVVERELPMFVEKPISIFRDPAERILKMVQEKDLLTSVGYHWRYSEAANKARVALQSQKPGMVLGYWLGDMPMVGWWRKRNRSGGQMVEQTTHIVDLARYLVGEVTEVYAVYGYGELKDSVEGVTIPDVGSITLKFDNGAVGTISNTCVFDQFYHTVGLDIITRDLVLEVRGDSVTERKKGETYQRRNGSDPYYEEDIAFIEAVKTGDRSRIRSSYADGYRTHQITVAANESAEKGQPIQLQIEVPHR
ncbi:Gfo/Idh/MocA family protein [Paludifilum halophilum]|uniref:Oxidoreductase n=1 Tax=Paludifilum halophilum TaxID=1642702 RepID=A0A235B814_9BACL|nr:Gfo/Idh/MocA family oxidoreductase [Paludifilum halophilum]OYD08453.1 hypothetical protein CHM34_06375 [Paludifilum halophilum]